GTRHWPACRPRARRSSSTSSPWSAWPSGSGCSPSASPRTRSWGPRSWSPVSRSRAPAPGDILKVVPESRRYQLRSEAANRLLRELVDAEGVPAQTRGFVQQMLTSVLKLHEDGAPVGDLKITNSALKELRYSFKVFAPYRDLRKVTVFGSARTSQTDPAAEAARQFGQRMVEAGWMVVTGAGAGIMGAAQEGAGGERSFGLNIRLPFEQEANPWIASDPKLITFKYFFTRKLFLVKEAHAFAMFPGG